jgi:hypothetical protein
MRTLCAFERWYLQSSKEKVEFLVSVGFTLTTIFTGLEELQKKLKAKDNLIRKLKSILKNKYGEDVPDDEDVQFGSGDGNWIGSSGAGVGNASATKAGTIFTSRPF